MRIEIALVKRGVRCVATVLDGAAPRTSAYMWRALPQEGDARHAIYSGHEIYTLVLAPAADPGPENQTIFPAAGDVMFFYFPAGSRGPVSTPSDVVDLAVFYDRDNHLLTSTGPTPGNRFATITEGLIEFAQACADMRLDGSRGERLAFRRI